MGENPAGTEPAVGAAKVTLVTARTGFTVNVLAVDWPWLELSFDYLPNFNKQYQCIYLQPIKNAPKGVFVVQINGLWIS